MGKRRRKLARRRRAEAAVELELLVAQLLLDGAALFHRHAQEQPGEREGEHEELEVEHLAGHVPAEHQRGNETHLHQQRGDGGAGHAAAHRDPDERQEKDVEELELGADAEAEHDEEGNADRRELHERFNAADRQRGHALPRKHEQERHGDYDPDQVADPELRDRPREGVARHHTRGDVNADVPHADGQRRDDGRAGEHGRVAQRGERRIEAQAAL